MNLAEEKRLIIKKIEGITDREKLELIRKVLDKMNKSKSSSSFKQFAGIITKGEAEAWKKAVEEGCGKIDPEW